MLALLGLSSEEIARITAVKQDEDEREKKGHAAKDRAKKGSMIGVHGAPGVAAPPADMWQHWLDLLKEMNVKWFKMLDGGDPHDTGSHSTFAWAKALKAAGIEPIIRYYVGSQFPGSLPDGHFEKMKKYAAADILWAEIGNEPNLDIEWRSEWRNRPNHSPMAHTNPDVIQKIAQTWVRDAKRALDAGVKPAFYAFAPTDWRGGSHPLYSSVFFTTKVVAQLAQAHRADTLDIFKRGGWIAVHASTYEQPVDFDTQRPDGITWDMTLRSYEVVLRAFKASFGGSLDVDKVIVMSTEGGVFTANSTSMNGHDRLQTDQEHATRTVEMFKWLERHSPLQAMCPWCLSVGGKIGHFDSQFQFDGWVQEINGQLINLPVVDAMTQLRFDQEREKEQQDPTHPLIKLDVPYISQFDATAKSRNADCGPTSLAMIINTGKPAAEHVTVDALYDKHLPNKAVGEFTFINEMLAVGQGEGLGLKRRDFPNAEAALKSLRGLIDQATPFVVLVNYEKLDDVTKWNFKAGHFFVVTGYDEEHVFVHDPLFRGQRRSEGQYFVWRNQKFLGAWGGFALLDNPNFAALVPQKTAVKLP
ncbi:MAG: C39 family peptidase [Chloroflexota bacterium]